jgi:hypothetical protein
MMDEEMRDFKPQLMSKTESILEQTYGEYLRVNCGLKDRVYSPSDLRKVS